jgi:hypothetical protein
MQKDFTGEAWRKETTWKTKERTEWKCEIRGAHIGVAEDSGLMACDSLLLDMYFTVNEGSLYLHLSSFQTLEATALTQTHIISQKTWIWIGGWSWVCTRHGEREVKWL